MIGLRQIYEVLFDLIAESWTPSRGNLPEGAELLGASKEV